MRMQEYQRGQILLIVVLIMVTSLTIGLSVAARSITNVRTSQDSANSEKAFSAAEAGIEQSLTSNLATSGTFTNNSKYSTTLITVAGTSFPLNNGAPVLQDSPVDLLLSTYPGYTNPWTGNFTIYWGQSVCTTTNTIAALEVVVLSGTLANPQMARYNIDPCAQRSLSNKFQNVIPGGGAVAGTAYIYSSTIAVTSGLFVRIVPLYAPAAIAVTGCNATNTVCNALPSQGTVIQSTGTSADTERQIVTYRYYPTLPSEILQYTLFVP
jgi:Tfp pilus assembly protein PilX